MLLKKNYIYDRFDYSSVKVNFKQTKELILISHLTIILQNYFVINLKLLILFKNKTIKFCKTSHFLINFSFSS